MFGALYAGSTAATVNLPNPEPVRRRDCVRRYSPKLANIDFDLALTVSAIPEERLPRAKVTGTSIIGVRDPR